MARRSSAVHTDEELMEKHMPARRASYLGQSLPQTKRKPSFLIPVRHELQAYPVGRKAAGDHLKMSHPFTPALLRRQTNDLACIRDLAAVKTCGLWDDVAIIDGDTLAFMAGETELLRQADDVVADAVFSRL